jgi:hypothetical protein
LSAIVSKTCIFANKDIVTASDSATASLATNKDVVLANGILASG